jgi:hypothetical protein
LTKITKYATVIFFIMALILGHLENRLHQSGSASEFEKRVQQKQMETPITRPPPPSQPAAAPTNNLLPMPLTSPTSMPAPAPTNMPAEPTQPK